MSSYDKFKGNQGRFIMKNIKAILIAFNAMFVSFAPLSLVNASEFSQKPFFLEQAKLEGEVKDKFADLDIGFGLKLFRFDILEGVSIAARYKYEVERSHKVGYHTRVDHWKVQTKINAGDIVESDMPLNFGINKDSSIYFIRQFPTRAEAMKAKAYTPKRLPINAQRAIERLVPGDFVSIPNRMTFTVGVSDHSSLDTNISAYYMISGEFIINIIRMKDKKVQVRLIAQNQKATGAGASVGFNFKAFQITALGKEIDKVIDLDLIQLGFSRGKGNQFVLDYIYDLANPEAAQAYNALLSSSYKFQDLKVIKNYLKKNDIENAIVGSYLPSDKLFYEDRNQTNPRVSRLFKGFNNYQTKKRNYGLNLQMAKLKHKKTLSKNIIAEENAEGARDYFLFHNYAVTKNHTYGIWPLRIKERSYQNFFGLLPVNKKLQSKDKYPDLGFSFDLRDKKYRASEHQDFYRSIDQVLPSIITDPIKWDEWESDHKRIDALVFSQLIINRNAFKNIKYIPFDTFYDDLKAFYKSSKFLEDLFASADENSGEDNYLYLPYQVKRAAKGLHAFLFQKGFTANKRLDLIMELRENDVFERVGLGFLLNLLNEQTIRKNIFFKMELQAHKEKPLTYEFGQKGLKNFYEYLQYITWALNGRSYDRRFINEN